MSFRQMLNEPVNKSQHGQFRETLGTAAMIILESEGHKPLSIFHDTPFGDHRALGVTAGIINSLVRTAKRRANKDMPSFFAYTTEQQIDIDSTATIFAKASAKQRFGLMRLSDFFDDI